MDPKSNKHIERLLANHSKIFAPQEKIYVSSNTVVLTESRLFKLGLGGGIKYEIPLEDIKGFSAKGTGKTASLIAETISGNAVNFGIVYATEYQEFQRALVTIHAGETPEYVEVGVKEKSVEVAGEQRILRDAPPHYGTVVANESFGLYKVRIFSDGYIQISKGLGLFKGSIEKLLGIEGESQITKKSALGRGLAGVVTLGKNQLAPNQRGNLILTITTDKVVHVLIEDLPQKQWIVSMNKLVAVGKSVIKKGTSTEVTAAPKDSSQSQSLAQQIRELSELKDAGVISEQEFESAKKKLLS
jgi:hypothetical protein